MDVVNKLEMMIAPWYQKLPRLPKGFTDWLAANVWWLALVGLILGVLSVFSVISITFFASAVLTGVGGVAGAALGGALLIGVVLSLVFSVIDIVLLSMAVTPLKSKLSKGWMLLFIIMLLQAASVIVSFLFSLNVFSLLWGLLFTAAGGYFLFEIRNYFKVAHVQPADPVKKAV